MLNLIPFLLVLLISEVSPVYAENLLSIYQQALQEDPQLKSAELKVEVGGSQKGQALGQLLPQVSATGNWSENKQVGNIQRGSNINYPGTRYYVSLSQSVFDFAKFWDWRRAQEVENQYASELIEAQHVMGKMVRFQKTMKNVYSDVEYIEFNKITIFNIKYFRN